MPKSIHLRAKTDIPAMRLRAGDIVSATRHGGMQVTVIPHPAPTFGEILAAFDRGDLGDLTADLEPAEDIRAFLSRPATLEEDLGLDTGL